MQNVFDLIANDSNEKKVDVQSEKLGIISELCCKQLKIEQELFALENQLKEKQKEYYDLTNIIIPDTFDELGLLEIKLSDGSKVSIKRSYAASITKDNQKEAFSWLDKNGFGAIIKHDVIVPIKKGEIERHRKLINTLYDEHFLFEDKESVHPSTLKAFVKEQIEAGHDLPMDLFSVFPIRQTKITK